MNLDKKIINFKTGTHRFSEQKETYIKYLIKFLDDKNFIMLGEAIKNNDYHSAFEYAHTLKGLAGSLSLDLLYSSTCVLVEELRINKTDNVNTLYNIISKNYGDVINMIKDL